MSTQTADYYLDVGATKSDCLPPMHKEAFIEVRHATLFGFYRPIEVSIDDRRVGHVGRHSPGRYQVRPGWHKLSAKMDWVRTQTVSVYLDADEQVVYCCGMESFASRVFLVANILLGLAIAASALTISLAKLAPGLLWPPPTLVGIGCFVPLGVCQLVIFSRMRPKSPPGRLIRLFRYITEFDQWEEH